MRSYSEQTAWQIDEAVRELITQAFDKATEILETHRQLLDDTAQKLLAKETLTADELPSIDEFQGADATDSQHRLAG